VTGLFGDKLEKAEAGGLRRTLRRLDSAQGRAALIGGREVVLFCSNDYLGLSSHPAIVEAARACVEKWGWGAGASRLISGTMAPHVEFEERVAAFLDKPAALLFNAGYAANVGALTALVGRGDTVFADRLCHASIIDGARFSGAALKRYRHNDPDSLKKLLEKAPARGARLIVTDGVFSMDGDIAPLGELAELAERFGATLMVDDAHGFGALGPEGKGAVHAAGVAGRVDIHVATLGKALGGSGGFVAGSRRLIEGLINFSRSFIYSTAPPPAVAAAGTAALELVSGPEGDRRRKNLHRSAGLIVRNLKQLGYNILSDRTQIVPIFFGDHLPAQAAGKRLLDRGVFVPVIRPPTVPKGTARLRLSVSASHTGEDIRKVTAAFAAAVPAGVETDGARGAAG